MRVLTIGSSGSTGQFAGLALPAPIGRGLTVRALVHDPAKAKQLAGSGGTRPRTILGRAPRSLDDYFTELNH